MVVIIPLASTMRQTPCIIHGDSTDATERSRRGRAAIAGISVHAIAGDGRNDAVRCNLPDHIMVRDKQIAGGLIEGTNLPTEANPAFRAGARRRRNSPLDYFRQRWKSCLTFRIAYRSSEIYRFPTN